MGNAIFIILPLLFFLYSSAFSQTTFKVNLSVAQTYQDDWRLGKKLALDFANILELNSKFKSRLTILQKYLSNIKVIIFIYAL